MPRATLKITPELLMSMFHLDDYEIKGATFDGRHIALKVEHPEIPEGADIIIPRYLEVNGENFLEHIKVMDHKGNILTVIN